MENINTNNVSEKIKPIEGMSCLKCPHAIWSRSIATNYPRQNAYDGMISYVQNKIDSNNKGQHSYDNLKCYCKLMHKKTWDVSIIEDEVHQSPDVDYVMQCEGRGE